MKSLIYIIAVLFPMSACCTSPRQGYLIEGKIKNLPDSCPVGLFRMDGDAGILIGQDTIVGGVFRFEGIADTIPIKLEFTADNSTLYGNLSLWTGNNRTRITGRSACISNWKVASRLPEQQEANRYRKLAPEERERTGRINQLLYDRKSKTTETNRDSLKNIRDSLNSIIAREEFALLSKRPFSPVSMEYLYRTAIHTKFAPKGGIDTAAMMRQYRRAAPSVRHSFYGEQTINVIRPARPLAEGERLIDATLPDTAGVVHRLSDYLGKYLLIDFWSYGCGPCHMAIPEMRQLSEILSDSVTIVSINVDSDLKYWKFHSRDIIWPNLSDGKGMRGGLAARYGIEGYPCFLLFDPEGILIDRWPGYYKGILKKKIETHVRMQ